MRLTRPARMMAHCCPPALCDASATRNAPVAVTGAASPRASRAQFSAARGGAALMSASREPAPGASVPIARGLDQRSVGQVGRSPAWPSAPAQRCGGEGAHLARGLRRRQHRAVRRPRRRVRTPPSEGVSGAWTGAVLVAFNRRDDGLHRGDAGQIGARTTAAAPLSMVGLAQRQSQRTTRSGWHGWLSP